MTKIAILPTSSEDDSISYRAVAGDKKTEGKTAFGRRPVGIRGISEI